MMMASPPVGRLGLSSHEGRMGRTSGGRSKSEKCRYSGFPVVEIVSSNHRLELKEWMGNQKKGGWILNSDGGCLAR